MEAAQAPPAPAATGNGDGEGAQQPQQRKAKPQAEAAKQTPYVVLQKLVADAGAIMKRGGGDSTSDEVIAGVYIADGKVAVWVPLYNQKAEHGKDGEVRIIEASSADAAIKTATKLDGVDAQMPGSFKAIPLRSWRGGVVQENEQKVVTNTKPLED